jgi:phage tail sheath protein FI
MSNALLSSKVVVIEEVPQIAPIVGVTTSVFGVIGVTERGPVDVATLITSRAEYQRIFGGYVSDGDVAQAIDGFYGEAGSGQCIVTRTCHHADPTDPTSAAADAATGTLTSPGPVIVATLAGKTPGSYANALTVKITAPSDGVTNHFNLFVVKAGVTIELWPNVSLNPADIRFAETIINDATTGSRFIAITSADVGGHVAPVNATYTMATGNDGLIGLVDADFIGGTGANGRVGLRTFDLLKPNLLAAPGRATAAVQNALLSYCEVTRAGSIFAILGPPAGLSGAGALAYVQTGATLEGISEFGAFFWPRIKVLNPAPAVFGVTADGYIAGVCARNDNAREGGVFDAPAGTAKGRIVSCLGFETDEVLDEDIRDLIYPHRINPITTIAGYGRCIDGVYTLKAGGNFPSISERRGVIFIEQSVKRGLEPARHPNNDETLQAEAARECEAFLLDQMKHGAFRSKDPKKAFFVDFGPGLNTPSVVFANKLLGRIGLATQKPAEFILVSFSQFTATPAT